MREVELGWGKVLLVKDNGEFHALGHKCPHYGAPLVKGEWSRCTREGGRDFLKWDWPLHHQRGGALPIGSPAPTSRPQASLAPPWASSSSSVGGVS